MQENIWKVETSGKFSQGRDIHSSFLQSVDLGILMKFYSDMLANIFLILLISPF